ncbi:MAG TPA: CoB--CoM heterodisulfide reductase iron-sulfur subunit A family protein [Desulfotomaculum sp.]|nr:CoB--CoM heterodisulfide reductase iron-sulfur subunit A family protein [Desulfotomaculum sp.]
MSDRRIGVYICHCGGNISDYVDVEQVRAAVEREPGVVVAKTAMFTCSDATQQEMVSDIQEQNLDGLVVASCSPKLHLFTFRDMARRAGLNPYQYTQVNIREQCSWAHGHDHQGATEKAIRLVRAGIARTALTEPLMPVKIETVPRVLVIGAGVAGLRAALGLADLGIAVLLVERSPEAGGWTGRFGKTYPSGKNGREMIARLVQEVKQRENITFYTGAELVEKSGSIGNFTVKIRISRGDDITANVGSIIVATGFEPYHPDEGEYGYGMDGVLTLPEFKEAVDGAGDGLFYKGREVKDVVYIYCVGSRQRPEQGRGHTYCSRYCCNAAVHASLLAGEKSPRLHQYHLFRDMRTYGRFELLYQQAREKGSIFLKFDENEPPALEKLPDGRLKVTLKDFLTAGEEISIITDLVVLVTGMTPRHNNQLTDILKLPVGKDGFYNEIHPKLRPVETVVDGVFICGTCQGPKNAAESVASALAAVTQCASILKKGYVELEPQMAFVQTDLCTWCGQCARACPYEAIEKGQDEGREVARVNEALCKGCGGCAPECPRGAINLKGYTSAQIMAMIDALAKEI